MIFKDYYKMLGLETNKVDLEEIKIAYRESAKKYHPDVNKEDKVAEEKFKDISEAYQILSRPSSKRKYDRSWNYYVGRKKKAYEISAKNINAKTKDFFNMFFGTKSDDRLSEVEGKNKKKTPVRGENIETEIEASIVDGFFGKEKAISLKDVDGSVKTFNVKIPEGIKNNEKIRLIGQGKPGKYGGKSGDLLINIKIKNTGKYTLDGVDLKTELDLSPWEATLGTELTITGLDEDVNVVIPKGTQTGDRIVIENKGYKDGDSRGNLILETKIMVPTELSDEEIKIYNKLKKTSKFNPRKS